MAIKDYSTSPGSNTALFPEGMSPSAVNDGMRQVQADVRSFYDALEWRDFGHPITYVDADTFTTTGDKTTVYTVGRRIKLVGSLMADVYATIASSSHSSGTTTVNYTVDSGTTANDLNTVFLGIDSSNQPVGSAAVSGLQAMIDAVKQAIYPVGSLYLNANIATNPATLLGFGTWAAYAEGRALVGAGSYSDGVHTETITAGTSFGEYQHQLTVPELPAHTHTERSANSPFSVAPGANSINTGFDQINSGSTGSTQFHNNIQPSIGIYVWRRVS